ncbi:hypothetical protein FRC08_012406 [Ceratobasidium sp. 394]|nr:hypothetical protein FRC08_012406 [Ceratobasidium sp. 394]
MKFSIVFVALFAGYAAAAAASCPDTCGKAAAKSAKCGGYKSKACVCNSKKYQSAARSCITSKCSRAEQLQALQFQQKLCGH